MVISVLQCYEILKLPHENIHGTVAWYAPQGITPELYRTVLANAETQHTHASQSQNILILVKLYEEALQGPKILPQ
jgi:hypothetical protein